MSIDKEKILDIAQKYILKGQSKKALKEYLKLIEANPQDKRLHLKIGDLYIKNGEEEKAIQEYLKVARLYGEEDLNFRAISIYKKILSINSKSIEAFHNIAKLYLKEGLTGSAKNYYQSILEIDPHNDEAMGALKNIEGPHQPLRELTPPPASGFPPSRHPHTPPLSSAPGDTSDLSSEPELSPLDKDSEMHYHLGIAYKEMDLFDYAVSEFELASSNSAMTFDCYIMIGNCYMERGDYNKSIEYFKMSSNLQGLSNEKLVRLHFNLGMAYEANGMLEEALRAFNHVLSLDPSFSEAKEKIKKLKSS